MNYLIDCIQDYLTQGGIFLSSGKEWLCDKELWIDSGVKTDRTIVIQSRGGTAISKGLGNDHYYSIFVVSRADVKSGLTEAKLKANEIVDYIRNSSYHAGLGTVQVQAPLSAPMQTKEQRVVFEIMIRCVK